MATITALEPQKHDPERINVYIDGKFAFGVSLMVAHARNIAEGKDVTDVEIEQLLHDDTIEKTYSGTLHFLSFRPRSTREIQDYFKRKKIDEEVGAAVLERLVRLGFVDDREFARFWLENRQKFRPRGQRALRLEMWQKGLSRDVIDEALEEAGDEDDLAVEAGRRKLRSLGALPEDEFRRKMIGFLQRRGFGYEAALRATKVLLEER